MKAFEIRAEAREVLKGQWGNAILAGLIYLIVTIAISFLIGLIPVVGPIIDWIISVPLSVGIISTFMKITRREKFGYFDFINNAIELFGKIWGVIGHVVLKMLVPVICLILSIVLIGVGAGMSTVSLLSGNSASTGAMIMIIAIIAYIASLIWVIVKGYLYSISYYILIDNKDISTKDVVEKSESLMMGNRGKLFCLGLSFIGWAILGALTFGIGYIWLIPYMTVSQILFYEMLIKKEQPSEEKAEE